jgi:hypothetical protein
MADGDGHFGPAALDKLHEKHRKNGTEGGACLTGHQGSFSNFNGKVTCNYRFQAWKQAQDHGGVKAALESYKSAVITGAIRTSAWKKIKPDYSSHLPKPRSGDWDVLGVPAANGPIQRNSFSGAVVKVPVEKNFTQETWPYWNNAHHLIPKGTLKDKIVAEGEPISSLVQKALMTAQYNINHKENMLLMPQDKRVADILGLPRHIQLRDNDASGLSAQCGNHPVYNLMACEIRLGLDSVMRSYRKIVDQAIKAVKGTHKVPKPALDKEKLVRLSRRLLKMILGASGAGLITKGQSLDAMATAA